jgi:hypothetical protein
MSYLQSCPALSRSLPAAVAIVTLKTKSVKHRVPLFGGSKQLKQELARRTSSRNLVHLGCYRPLAGMRVTRFTYACQKIGISCKVSAGNGPELAWSELWR